MENRPYWYSFERDESEGLSNNGTYTDVTITKITFKFPEQASFFIPSDATEPVGKRIKELDYTGQNILTRESYMQKVKEESNRVKNLKGKSLPWYVNPRPDGQSWMKDSVKKMKGVG